MSVWSSVGFRGDVVNLMGFQAFFNALLFRVWNTSRMARFGLWVAVERFEVLGYSFGGVEWCGWLWGQEGG